MANGTTRQPVYRRPSWAQTETSYKIYTRKDLASDRSPGSDYGLDNFSYDPAHIPKWQAPDDISKRLPSEIRDTLEDWEFAGAAVCTALDRIQKLDNDSIHRGWPDKTSRGHLSRSVSNASPLLDAESPIGSPLSPAPSMPNPLILSLESLSHRRALGMESPPFTPTEGLICRTPDLPNIEKNIPLAAIPDAHLLARQLSPISIRSRSDSAVTTPGGAVFDENAWEVFIGGFKAELGDIRQRAWSRFKGFGYTIDRMRIEFASQAEHKTAIEDFNVWWAEKKPMITEYEQKVRGLDIPSLELVRMERVAHGLPA